MDDTDKLISVWKSNTFVVKSGENINFLKSNKDTMDTIIQFESREKQEKNKQIGAAFALIILTGILLFGSPISIMTIVGILLVAIAVAYGIIANRTDNFPDIRQLNTKEYLVNFRDNTLKRTKMHRINTFIGLCFAIPGLFLTFKDAFPQLGYWWIPIMFTSGFLTSLAWFKDYNKRSGDVIEKVTHLIEEFES